MAKRSSVYVLVSALPVIAASLLVQWSEPLPHGWLDPTNDHYWANLVRAFGFLIGGLVLGMIVYTMSRSVAAEGTVTGGYPRRLLYRHVTVISAAHGLLILTVLFYIRDRLDQPLSPATPLAVAGMVATVYGLALMTGYQNSRLARFHAAKQVLGTIEPERRDGGPRLCLRVLGSTEPVGIDEWLSQYNTGEVVRLTVEKVEEAGEPGSIWGRRR